ncbi:MAG: DUF4125 family protein [Lachnospiraceae bacterium]|nr:DUF4125 family protein [Lachnospiraceae bacterium]
MNIQEKLSQLDRLDYKDSEGFLMEAIKEAKREGDKAALITLLNEMIGFCRDSTQHNKSKIYSNELLTVLEEENLEGTQGYATSLLNIANADRAAGDLEESLEYFERAEQIYKGILSQDDFLFAGLYNNKALLYQEMMDYENACDCLKKALKVVKQNPGKVIEEAITLSNLAQSELRCGRFDEAKKDLDLALAIFRDGREDDFHFSGALAVYAELMYNKKQYATAAKYYGKAMDELQRHIGKTGNYDILRENRDDAIEKAAEAGQDISDITETINPAPVEDDVKGLKLCRSFYEEIGAKMIHERFESYESRIAVGLVGEGSDCFGFDDDISRDHDWGPGFCMWLDDVTYDAIGEQLQKAYDELPVEYMGYRRRTTVEAKNRTGVMRIREFYEKLLHTANVIPRTGEEWFAVAEEDLATVTNGEIFRDDDGVFFGIRNALLAYYPEKVFRQKLAYVLIRMAQTGQYNYRRSLERGDKVTATMYISEFMEHTLHALFLLNRKYAPYKKWLMKSASTKLRILPEITDILRAIADMDIEDPNISGSVEIIAQLVLNELKNQKYVIALNRRDPYFLEPYGQEIYAGSEYISMDERVNMNSNDLKHNELVDRIAEEEWAAFDKVINEGGRASCQDDRETFMIMRKSQYMTWTDEMLESFIADFENAKQAGWNLITEKYGRMEESTAPEEYAKIKDSLPERDEKTRAIVEEIVKIQVGCMEDLATLYPNVATSARSIHTFEDTPWNTSYETYLRGELLTYSPETLALYGEYIVGYVKNEKNPAMEIMTNTAHLYGYRSLDELEKKLGGSSC